jgi:dTDP-4-amino-4,6-dideoxygalactose transaminase
VAQCGATPVFVDVLPDSYNIDPEGVAEAITPLTKAIMVVHLFGLCADMASIRDVTPQGIHIIEDAACATGATYRGAPAGGLGVIGCFSFHPRKTVTCGEGGMLTTRDHMLAERARILRNHGGSVSEEARHRGLRPYELPAFEVAGFNYRMTDIQAAFGLVQLGKLDRFLDERRALAARYQAALAGISWLRPPRTPQDCGHAWQAYVTLVDGGYSRHSRDEILAALHDSGIAGRPGTHTLTRLGVYKDSPGARGRKFPVADRLADWTLALPLHNRMTSDDVDRVVERLAAIMQ